MHQALFTLAAEPSLREMMGQASRVILDVFSCEAFARSALLAARAAHGENIPAPPDPSAAKPPLDVARGLAS
jgi:hypothetical protein